MFDQATSLPTLPPMAIMPLHPASTSINIKKYTINEANLETMKKWFYENHPDESTTLPKLPFLRSISGPIPNDGNYWDWSNMLISHIKNHNKTKDVATTMKQLAKEAIIYGINCTDTHYKMPEQYLAKYNKYFMTFLSNH